MERSDAIEIVKKNLPAGRYLLSEALRTLVPELKESENKEKPNGGIVLESFNEGEGFYKVNLAYLNKEQVIEIEELVKKWNPELKESEDERIRRMLIEVVKITPAAIALEHREEMLAYLEKQGSQNLANSEKTCKVEQKPTLPGFEEQEGVAGRDYIPVEWVEAIENYGKWKIVRVNEQNPVWSGEDEEALRVVTNIFEQHGVKLLCYPALVHWLKTLPNRITFNPYWKPSDEQINALKMLVRYNDFADQNQEEKIVTLFNDLKKLKG